jgi:hypothetical protein
MNSLMNHEELNVKSSRRGRGLAALVAGLALVALAGTAGAQTGFSISGAMSNFDCTNRTDDVCDEIEIDIEGASPADVIHTYTNGNYGAPSVSLSSDGRYTIVSYRNPQHVTQVGSIEHFGVTLRGAVYYGPPAVYHPTHVHWYRNGQLATVNGHIPTADGGTAPATQPALPSISASVVPGVPGPHGNGGLNLSITNNDSAQPIWIKRSAQVTRGQVTLEALMPNNPVVTTSLQIDTVPIRLMPRQTLTLARDLLEFEEEQSVVFSAEYYQNVQTGDPFDPFNNPLHDSLGPLLGNIMTAQLASPANTGCIHHPASITSQPQSVTGALNARIDLRVTARGDDVAPLTYAWMKDGVLLNNNADFSGVDSSHLRIEHLTAATEGFYTVRVTNQCIDALSDSAMVFLTGHNVPPPVQRPVPAPTISQQPQSKRTCAGQSKDFKVSVADTIAPTYQWKFTPASGGATVNVFNSVFISGANTDTLTLSNVSVSNSGQYFCIVTNSGGTATSNPATLSVGCRNVADVAGVGGGPGCDGEATVDDLVYYLGEFFSDDRAVADIVGLGGSPIRDGQITVDDLVAYLNAFFTGCP